MTPTHLPCTHVASFMKRLPAGFTNMKGPWNVAAACGCIIVGHGPSWNAPPAQAAMLWPSPTLPWSEHRRVMTFFAMGANSSRYSSL